MNTKRILAGALASVSLVAAGLTMGSGTASAIPSQPHQWCPGMPMHNPPGPGAMYVWDMNVCHTWQRVKSGMGNVARKVWTGPLDPVTYQYSTWEIQVEGSDIFDGPVIPPGSAAECTGRDMFTGIPIPC